MVKTKIMELDEFGQSIWFDNISRSLIGTGRLKELIALGLCGMKFPRRWELLVAHLLVDAAIFPS